MKNSVDKAGETIVYGAEKVIKVLRITDHVLEFGLVVLVLVTTGFVSGNNWVEWIGVFAVILTFEYTLIANRMGEKNRVRDCAEFRKLMFCYYGKEVLWLVYFIVLGAWSALVGVFIFMMYGWWRLVWVKHHKSGAKVLCRRT